MDDTPIDKEEYMYGVKVVDIGDLRVARGKTRRPKTTCKHLNITYCTNERRIFCDDCQSAVDPFDIVVGIAEFLDGETKKLISRRRELDEAISFNLRSIAAKNIDSVWRGRRMAPICPHCKSALLPEDFKTIGATVSVEFARKRREKDGNK